MGHRILVQGANYSDVAVNADFFVDIHSVKSSINTFVDGNGKPIEQQGAIYSNIFTVPAHSIIYSKDTVNYDVTIMGILNGTEVARRLPQSQICCYCDNITDIIVAVKPITENAAELNENSLSDVVTVIDGSKWDADINVDWRKMKAFESRIVNTAGLSQVKVGAILFGFVYLPTGSSITVNKADYAINIAEYSRMILSSETYRVDVQIDVTNYTMKGDNFVMFSIKHTDGSTEQITKDMAKSIISINKA